jgi:hypothetical protein
MMGERAEPRTSAGCFAKGTPVHTRDGLTPIDEIRVADWVLAAPEDGAGTPAYKRVANTFVHQQKTIRKISTYAAQSGTQYFVSATGDHPFWVEGRGWTRADVLGRHTALRGTDGTAIRIDSQWPVYRTGQPGIGWVQVLSDVVGSHGGSFDYERYDLAPDADPGEYPPPGILESEQPFLAVTVYDIEVEDYHSYFVGYDGLWVHDANR